MKKTYLRPMIIVKDVYLGHCLVTISDGADEDMPMNNELRDKSNGIHNGIGVSNFGSDELWGESGEFIMK